MSESMQFFIHIQDQAQRSALSRMLSLWMSVICASAQVADWPSTGTEGPAVLFWELGAEEPPPVREDLALFLCSADPREAISSYTFHPTGFLRMPFRMDELRQALRRCSALWWEALERVELQSGRLRLRLPLYDLVWAEGARRGCVVHSSQESLVIRDTLSSLSQHLPGHIFLRCQRSFLVNLCHVSALDGDGLHLFNGTTVPLSRGSRSAVAEAYRQFRCLLDSGTAEEVVLH